MRLSAALAALSVLGCAGGALAQNSSPGLRQVWTLKIGEILEEPPGWTSLAHHEMQGLAFSPDGKRLAVTMTHIVVSPGTPGTWNTHLFIVDVGAPKATVRRLSLVDTCGLDLSWNSKGNALLVCGTIIQLEDGANCMLGKAPLFSLSRYWNAGQAVWFGAEHVVGSSGKIFDLSCTQKATWPLKESWRFTAVDSANGWVLFSQSGIRSDRSCGFSLIDRSTHRLLNGWPVMLPCDTRGAVASGVNAICFSGIGTKSDIQCRTADGAKVFPRPMKLRGYELIQSAAKASLAVAEQWTSSWFDLGPAQATKRVIFDLLTGTKLASWKPRIQHSTSASILDWPYRCALSPNADRYAESGDDLVELYKIN